jgi:hypothetical protein
MTSGASPHETCPPSALTFASESGTCLIHAMIFKLELLVKILFHHEVTQRVTKVLCFPLCNFVVVDFHPKYAITTKTSIPTTATIPNKLNAFCQNNQLCFFSSRFRKNPLKGRGIFSFVRLAYRSL